MSFALNYAALVLPNIDTFNTVPGYLLLVQSISLALIKMACVTIAHKAIIVSALISDLTFRSSTVDHSNRKTPARATNRKRNAPRSVKNSLKPMSKRKLQSPPHQWAVQISKYSSYSINSG
jgi:hypothetical protein